MNNYAKSLENSKSALVCCSDEWRGLVSNNSPSSESYTSTSPCNPLDLTENFQVTVLSSWNTENTKLFKIQSVCNFSRKCFTISQTKIDNVNI